MPIKLYLWIWTFEFHVIFVRHKIFFFLFSFQPFSNAKTILSLPAITKHGSRQDLALGPKFADPWYGRLIKNAALPLESDCLAVLNVAVF